MNWLQRHWDARAAANFILGGAGAGLIVFAPLTGSRLQVLVGLALICVGLGAVWLEIGRKLRALHVFLNPFTSWMTREAFCALLVLGFGLAFALWQERALLYLAAASATAFLYCQARILRAAKGIPAWRVAEVVPLIVLTGLTEGAGLALLFGAPLLPVAALALARLWASQRYCDRVGRAELESPARALLIASLIALGFAVLSGFVPWFAGAAAALVVAPGWWLKFALVTRAAFNQGFSLPHLPVRGARQEPS
jgi:phenylacetyl-CoA:acceptor oxidoreductase 26-kDa subunit